MDEVVGVKRDVTCEDLGNLQYLSQVTPERWATGDKHSHSGSFLLCCSTVVDSDFKTNLDARSLASFKANYLRAL